MRVSMRILEGSTGLYEGFSMRILEGSTELYEGPPKSS